MTHLSDYQMMKNKKKQGQRVARLMSALHTDFDVDVSHKKMFAGPCAPSNLVFVFICDK